MIDLVFWAGAKAVAGTDVETWQVNSIGAALQAAAERRRDRVGPPLPGGDADDLDVLARRLARGLDGLDGAEGHVVVGGDHLW